MPANAKTLVYRSQTLEDPAIRLYDYAVFGCGKRALAQIFLWPANANHALMSLGSLADTAIHHWHKGWIRWRRSCQSPFSPPALAAYRLKISLPTATDQSRHHFPPKPRHHCLSALAARGRSRSRAWRRLIPAWFSESLRDFHRLGITRPVASLRYPLCAPSSRLKASPRSASSSASTASVSR